MTIPTPTEEPVEEQITTRRSESRETTDTAVTEEEEMEDEVPTADKQYRDKRTRFEMDERRPAGATALTDTMTSDGTFVPVLEEDNQAAHRTEDLRYQMMERKIERLEKRLEAYESLQRRQAKNKVHEHERSSSSSSHPTMMSSGASDMQHLIEFFLTEMDKQNAVIAQMRANQRVLEQKLDESMRKTHRFHHDQLERMTKFQEVVQIMNSEFVRGARLRDEEKMLEKTCLDKKTKAVRRALDEQIQELKHETSHQRRRLEIKFEKKIVELVSENQLLRTENLELRDELNHLGSATRSNKRTVRILSDEVIKLKRTVGAAPNPDMDEVLRVSSYRPTTSTAEVHPTR